MYGQIQATDPPDVWCGERRVRTPDSASCPRAMSSDVPKPKLLDQMRLALRSRHYSRRTEQTYVTAIQTVVLSGT